MLRVEEGCGKPVLGVKGVVNQCLEWRKDLVNQWLEWSKGVVNQCLQCVSTGGKK